MTTTNKILNQPANGADINTWDVPMNANFGLIDSAFGGITTINATSASGTVTLTSTQFNPPNIAISGTLTAAVNYQFPSGVGWFGTISNSTTGAHAITISSAGAGTSITVPQGYAGAVVCDGTNVSYAAGYAPVLATGTLSMLGATSGAVSLAGAAAAGSTTFVLPAADGTSGQFIKTDGSANLSFATPAGGVSLSGDNTWTGVQSFAGTSAKLGAILTDAAEICTVNAGGASGTINLYLSTQAMMLYTGNATANWTLNVAQSSGTALNTSLAVGQSVTVAFLATQGSTAYFLATFKIDGTTQTVKWLGGSAPTAGTPSGIDIYVLTCVKTAANTYTVIGSQSSFG